jgi:flagellar biosynthetic protein FliQ
MNIEQCVEILRGLVTMALLLISPILGAAIVTGLVVSVIQSVTSIQEQTLSFVPKLLAVSAVLVIGAPWMLKQLMQFTVTYISKMGEMVH